MNSTVLDRADVGPSALVAAGSVVLPGTTVAGGTLWAGNPARYKRDLKPEEVKGLETFWKNYLDYKVVYLADDARMGR